MMEPYTESGCTRCGPTLIQDLSLHPGKCRTLQETSIPERGALMVPMPSVSQQLHSRGICMTRTIPRPALIFDLDGTLVDSVYQHVLT
jgi:hypothetical protein